MVALSHVTTWTVLAAAMCIALQGCGEESSGVTNPPASTSLRSVSTTPPGVSTTKLREATTTRTTLEPTSVGTTTKGDSTTVTTTLSSTTPTTSVGTTTKDDINTVTTTLSSTTTMGDGTFVPDSIPTCSGTAAGTPVQQHGRLSVQGNKIVNECNQPVRLRGMSLYWSQWSPQYWTKDTLQWLRDDWKITVFRAPLGVEADMGGYMTSPEVAAAQTALVTTVVDAAIELGLYVIIDWHDHNAHLPEHTAAAMSFFDKMAKKYAGQPNVLFETWNEPVPELSWSDIKPYHEKLTSVIRAHTDNIVLLSSQNWAQYVDISARDPVAGRNLAYSVHFYAGSQSHSATFQATCERALNLGVALFASEWGVCHWSGKGDLALDTAQGWVDFFDKHYISDTAWSVNNKDEGCSALKPQTATSSGWTEDDLAESGWWYRNSLLQ